MKRFTIIKKHKIVNAMKNAGADNPLLMGEDMASCIMPFQLSPVEQRKSVSIAVPTTWPPETINGVVVAGFDSPVCTGIDGSFCHPEGLYEEILRRFGGLPLLRWFGPRPGGSGKERVWVSRVRVLLSRKGARGEIVQDRTDVVIK